MVRFGDATDWPAIAPNADDLPYEIRLRGWALWRTVAFYLIFGTICLGAPAWLLWAAHSRLAQTAPTAIVVGAFGFLFVGALGLGFYVLAYAALSADFRLHPDRIEEIGLRNIRSIRRNAIEGIEIVGDPRQWQFFRLKPVSPLEKPIQMHRKVLADPVFAAWLSGIRDLTAEAFQRSEAEVLTDTRFGATQEERARRLASARRLARGFQLVGIGIVFWVFIRPEPYLWALGAAVAVPWVAMALVWGSGGLITWAGDSTAARPQVLEVTMVTIMMLVFRAIMDVRQEDWPGLAVAAGIGGVIAAMALTLLQRRRPKIVGTLFLALLPAGYFYAVAAQANVFLDNSKPETFPVHVMDKSANTGRYVTYELKLGSWSGHPATTTLVSRQFYDEVQVNSTICIYEHPGWLRLRWFHVNHCKGWKPAPPPSLPRTRISKSF